VRSTLSTSDRPRPPNTDLIVEVTLGGRSLMDDRNDVGDTTTIDGWRTGAADTYSHAPTAAVGKTRHAPTTRATKTGRRRMDDIRPGIYRLIEKGEGGQVLDQPDAFGGAVLQWHVTTSE